jgi:hypothetical protein
MLTRLSLLTPGSARQYRSSAMHAANRFPGGSVATDGSALKMQDQKKSLMSAERAIKRLAKLARRVSDENMANWMIEGDSLASAALPI